MDGGQKSLSTSRDQSNATQALRSERMLGKLQKAYGGLRQKAPSRLPNLLVAPQPREPG
jgi:hypothetical protein